MKLIPILLVVLGFLLFGGGLLLFITNEINSRGLILGDEAGCSTANKEQLKLEELVKQYDAGKGTPKEIGLQFEVENQIKIAERWGKTCGTGKSWARFRFTVFLSVMVIGFYLLITGFFIGRKKGEKVVRKTLLASIFAVCLSLSDCKDLAKNRRAEYVDRTAVFTAGNTAQRSNPLAPVVEIAEDGGLSLNKIETGTITDPALLSGKLKVIFEDREKASVKEREVLIDPQVKVRNEDLEKLVETLASIKASPNKVIKDNL